MEARNLGDEEYEGINLDIHNYTFKDYVSLKIKCIVIFN
jgi:hypothetical protein